MLRMFRKTTISHVLLIIVMLLVPVQQSFSRTVSRVTSSFDVVNNNKEMKHCKITAETGITTNSNSADSGFTSMQSDSTSMQQGDCCVEDLCDSSNCSFSISFLALFPNQYTIDSFEPQRHIVYVEQREILVLSSELFRPPRNIQLS